MEVGFVEGFVGDGCIEEGKGDGGSFGGVWNLLWNRWRWRRKKMMLWSFRCCCGCCCSGDEGGVGDD